ncbi:2-oxo acid dehydrogenase subunit E2 [Neobacillus terrae]|uniref:2-oxo acid dehydrogenase subunit E2 n=1 Tax=Neobacillus terrae TaxID=3034837 RepID=UPI00140A63F1|nr:2-oxo acid dehydrogenase subunit E2 [Neobacillus terrae]NHM31464.1 2-oxo acid dehydrogenase subunit E2 [Neobacillus terrae]
MQDTKTLHDITLPRLSEADEESLITFWHKSEGDTVKKGDVLVEVQTEKAVSEIESDTDGVIVKIHKKRGEVIGVGQPLASIAEEEAVSELVQNQSISVLPVEQEKQQDKSFVKASPRVRKLAKDLGVDLASVTGTGKNGEPTVEDVQKAARDLADTSLENEVAEKPAVGMTRIVAPPSVRKLAREKGVDLEELQGKINRKINKEDILNFAEKTEATAVSPSVETTNDVEIVKLGGIRKAIAKAMTYSKQTIPHVTHFAEADVTALAAHRERLKEAAKSKQIKLTFLPYVVKALISALKEYKELNASVDEKEENILYKKYYNIGIAVQTDNGLVVPVVKNPDSKNISTLAKEIDQLTTTARENKLTMDQMKEGTCTISNIGSAGGEWFTPVINHPETSILGIGKIVEKPIVKNGVIAIGKMMSLSLSYDHRVIDGVIAQNALNHIKSLLEDPELLLLELE